MMRISNTSAFICLALVCFSFMGCKPKRPNGILSEGKMEKVMVDYHLAQGMAEAANEGDLEATRYKYIQAVFKKHHITDAEFDSSLVYYFENSEKFLEEVAPFFSSLNFLIHLSLLLHFDLIKEEVMNLHLSDY